MWDVRAYIYELDRSTSFSQVRDMITAAYDIEFETAIPGGMTVASMKMPWRGEAPSLIGKPLAIYDGSVCVWWGRIGEVSDVVNSQQRVLELTAYGPWERAARIPFTQTYTTNSNHRISNIVKAAIGNLPDVATTNQQWSGTTTPIEELSFEDSTVQSVILDSLRLGDDSTSPWTFIVLPPVQVTGVGGFTYASDYTTPVDSTLGGVSDSYFARKISGTVKFAADASGTSYDRITFGTATANAVAGAWFYVPRNAGVIYDFITFRNASNSPIAYCKMSAGKILQVLNIVSGVTTNGSDDIELGTGSWHFIGMRITVSAGSGVLSLGLDGQNIVAVSSVNTGSNNVKYVCFGLAETSPATARTMWVDDILVDNSSSITRPEDAAYTHSSCETRLIKVDGSSWDFEISIADIPNYRITETSKDMINHLYVGYSSSGLYTGRAMNNESVALYGLYPGYKSISGLNSNTVAGYYRARYLEQYGLPRKSLQSITITKRPRGLFSNQIPLSSIRAGMNFRVRDLPNLGNMIVGHTRYQAPQGNRPESVEITPEEPPVDITYAVARSKKKTL